jgi:hypothetical protein
VNGANYTFISNGKRGEVYYFNREKIIESFKGSFLEYSDNNPLLLRERMRDDLVRISQEAVPIFSLCNPYFELGDNYFSYMKFDQFVVELRGLESLAELSSLSVLEKFVNIALEDYLVSNISTGNRDGLIALCNVPVPRTIKILFIKKSWEKNLEQSQPFLPCFEVADDLNFPSIYVSPIFGE